MKRLIAVLLCAVMLISLCSCNVKSPSITGLFVRYIDVGQGDAELITFPNGKNMLIDSGPSGAAKDFLSYLDSLNVTRLDYVVATHPHADHIGNMAKVIEKYEIGEIYMPKISTNTKTFEKMLDAIEAKGLSVNSAKAGVNIVNEGNLQVDIVSPKEPDYEEMNNNSAVIMLKYNKTSFLFMGDAEKEAEEDISTDVKADVIKIGHHGSSTSTTEDFLKKVSPKYAVICVGDGNSYNHPYQETLDLLDKYKITYYRTDRDKTVVFTSDGNGVKHENNG